MTKSLCQHSKKKLLVVGPSLTGNPSSLSAAPQGKVPKMLISDQGKRLEP